MVTGLETGQVDDETALFLTAGAVIAVGKYAPKAAKTRAFARIGMVLRRITARIGLAARKRELVEVLVRRGTKVTPEAVVDIRRLADGRIVWLEKGDLDRGLEHIFKHTREFAGRGVAKSQIPDLIFEALESGKIVRTIGSGVNRRNVYQVSFNGKIHTLSIGVGNNGYIVTAHPFGGY